MTILPFGNFKSIFNMLDFLGYKAKISMDIKNSSFVIIPGVGSFDSVAKDINELKEILEEKKVLGICLGMHLMCKSSEEGKLKGLGVFDVEVKKLPFKNTKIGWQKVENEKYYFLHSFYVPVNKYTTKIVSYNDFKISAEIRKNNFIGVQFHPEKSGKWGMKYLKKIIDE